MKKLMELIEEIKSIPSVVKSNDCINVAFGLTKRELFARMAIQCFCASHTIMDGEKFAILSVGMADSLMKELDRESESDK